MEPEPKSSPEALVKTLSPEDYERTFWHPWWKTVSIEFLVQSYIWHGSHHVTQIISLRERMGGDNGAPWESRVGYCRAIKAGKHIYVTGTASVDDQGETFAPGQAYEQTKRCLEIIDEALQELGAGLPDVVRTRLFVTDISRWEAYGQAHQEAFN